MREIEMPYNLEAEKAVIGSILIDEEAIYQVLDKLQPQDFYSEQNKILFSKLIELFTNGKKIDFIILSEELEKAGLIEKIGGRAYLADCSSVIATSSNIKQYSDVVLDKSLRRQLIKAQFENEKIIFDEGKDIDSVVASTQANIIKINNFNQLDDGVDAVLKDLNSIQNEFALKYERGQKYLGFSSGFEKIDQAIDGIRPGHIWVVGAWTSTGKTQFALNIVNAVLDQNIPTSIISLEMSRVDTLSRLIGIKTKISSMAVLKGKNSFEEQYQIETAKDFFKKAPLQIHTTYFDLEKIKMLIRTDVYTKKTKFIVIDYVQNIISEKGSKEYDLMTQAATDLQALARELGVTIYIVSQVNNESEKGLAAGAGFKGTGALEAVADLAIKLERDRKKESPLDAYVPLKIKIVKNRHGFTGVVENYFLWLKSGKIEFGLSYV